jgi:hypothetical protein
MFMNKINGLAAKNSGEQAGAAMQLDSAPLEFRVILSACRIFLGTEEPAKLEALLQQGPDGVDPEIATRKIAYKLIDES